MDAMDRPSTARWKYVYWAIVGGLLTFGTIGILTIGLVFFVPGLALGLGGLKARTLSNRSTSGLIAGVAVGPLWLAWLNRHGPGTVCSGTSCEDMYSPWPFVAVGVAMLAAFVMAVRAR